MPALHHAFDSHIQSVRTIGSKIVFSTSALKNSAAFFFLLQKLFQKFSSILYARFVPDFRRNIKQHFGGQAKLSAALERSLPHYQNKSLFSLWMTPKKETSISFISFMMMVFLFIPKPQSKTTAKRYCYYWYYWVSIKRRSPEMSIPKPPFFTLHFYGYSFLNVRAVLRK